MYKSQLNELCNKKKWKIPDYRSNKEGPDHIPSFRATVVVNGVTFDTPICSKTAKEAQSEAARIAFLHFTAQTVDPLLRPQQCLSFAKGSIGGFNILPSDEDILLKNQETHTCPPSANSSDILNVKDCEGSLSDFSMLFTGEDIPSIYEETQSSTASANSLDVLNVKEYEGSFNDFNSISTGEDILSKNQEKSCSASTSSFYLSNVNEYEVEVTVGGQTFGSSELFRTIKEAENAAARIALSSLLVGGMQEIDSAFYKNLLQQLISRRGFSLPKYDTVRSGEPHSSSFISTVQVEDKSYEGVAAKTKKQAEINAAKIALDHLKQSGSPKTLACITQTDQPENLIVPAFLDSTMVSIVNGRSAERISRDPLTSGPSIEVGDEEVNLLAYSTSEDKVIEDGTSLSSPATTCSKLSDLSLTSATTSAGPKMWRMITVLPRKPNMSFPDDANILPYSHDKWVAYEIWSPLK